MAEEIGAPELMADGSSPVDPASALILARLDQLQQSLDAQRAALDQALVEGAAHARIVANPQDELEAVRTDQQQRAAELALINSVQHALAAQLDMQGVVNAVGDKVREIFDAKTGFIALIDHDTAL